MEYIASLAQSIVLFVTVTMKQVFIIFNLIFLACCQEYVPGTPGGAWSQEELLAVRAKLWKLFTNNWTYKLSEDFAQDGLPAPDLENDLGFLTAKVLRLRLYHYRPLL